jgi:hypothetical protein
VRVSEFENTQSPSSKSQEISPVPENIIKMFLQLHHKILYIMFKFAGLGVIKRFEFAQHT